MVAQNRPRKCWCIFIPSISFLFLSSLLYIFFCLLCLRVATMEQTFGFKILLWKMLDNMLVKPRRATLYRSLMLRFFVRLHYITGTHFMSQKFNMNKNPFVKLLRKVLLLPIIAMILTNLSNNNWVNYLTPYVHKKSITVSGNYSISKCNISILAVKYWY